jgi:hypothetical protein
MHQRNASGGLKLCNSALKRLDAIVSLGGSSPDVKQLTLSCTLNSNDSPKLKKVFRGRILEKVSEKSTFGCLF